VAAASILRTVLIGVCVATLAWVLVSAVRSVAMYATQANAGDLRRSN
jgi:hypothetical protein